MRIKISVPRRARHKKLLALTKGYRGIRKHSTRLATQAVLKAGVYSYRDRRNKKRLFRANWIVKINAALGSLGLKYGQFTHSLKKANIEIDRKILSQLAVKEPAVFQEIVNKVK